MERYEATKDITDHLQREAIYEENSAAIMHKIRTSKKVLSKVEIPVAQYSIGAVTTNSTDLGTIVSTYDLGQFSWSFSINMYRMYMQLWKSCKAAL